MALFYNNNFEIRLIRKRESDSFLSTDGEEILRLVTDRGLFGRDQLCICADPFLFGHGGELYLFYEYERKRWGEGKGEIHMIKTADLKVWSKDVRVLEEDFHLSFPNVFGYRDEVYMLPECNEDGSIRLYRAVSQGLDRWELVRKLVDDGLRWADSTLIVKDGLFYLFSSRPGEGGPEAHLFISESLDGVYRPHPCSPIDRNRATSRNAGSIILKDGAMFRPVQDCSHSYGKQVSILRIDRLSPTEYSEHPEKLHILNTDEPFYNHGGHQFNAVNFNGRTIVATDAKKRNFNVPAVLGTRIGHLRRIFGRK